MMIQRLSHFLDIRTGEAYRVGVIASLLFFLIAANNLIKIIRDTVFLSHHPVSELPYLYIVVAIVAGVLIALYGRYISNLPVTGLILVTNAIVILNIIFFWFLLTFLDPGWSHYAFYIWSAIAGVIAVAQAWTLTNEIFSASEGKRLFGLVAAGGTLGGAAAGFGTQWAVGHFVEINDLLWVLAGIFFIASVLVFRIDRRLRRIYYKRQLELPKTAEPVSAGNIGALLTNSRFLKTIAALILISVIVSTLIDFELKTTAKQAYPSEEALARFFSSYYAWLSVAAFFAQVVLTGKALTTFGLISSLYLTPGALLVGVLAIMTWPSVLAAAMTRMTDAVLRNSVQRSSMEVLYMSLPTGVKKGIKTFLDVVVERAGDATAGFIILFTLSYTGTYNTYVHFVCIALILVWMLVIALLRTRQQNELPVDEYSRTPVITE